MNQKIKIPTMVLEGGPLRPEGIISAIEEELMTCTTTTVSDDVLDLNPPGGSSADVPSTKKCVFSCKSKESLGTWNVRSMYQGKLESRDGEIRIGSTWSQ